MTMSGSIGANAMPKSRSIVGFLVDINLVHGHLDMPTINESTHMQNQPSKTAQPYPSTKLGTFHTKLSRVPWTPAFDSSTTT